MAHFLSNFLLALLLAVCFASHSNAQQKIDFEKQVAPILQTHCIQCHGPKVREGGLRFTNRHDALLETDSTSLAIVPGKPDDSHLIDRIVSTDESDMMPPEGGRLSKDEIATLRQWIVEGAVWSETDTKKHWAYVVPKQSELPKVKLKQWPRNAIDFFVLNKLEQKGWSPSPPAEPARLLRRTSLALTGLPPTIEQVDKFLKSPTEQAYEKFVDDCLQSKTYGQRWAQPWLDLARYADSNGFQADQLRDSWAYRDWVIDAMNQDQPFDQFTIEQLAGDLIPDATKKQKIATGFHRTVTCNVEAGVHPEENRINQVFDRVNTTGTVFLGTTIECCQCHNHKYDPFTQDEYYQLFAFFNNTPMEVKLQAGVQYNFYGPKVDLDLSEPDQARFDSLQSELKQLELEHDKLVGASAETRKTYLKRVTELADTPIEWTTLEIDQVKSTGGETSTVLDDQSILFGGKVPNKTTYTIAATSELKQIKAFRIDALTHESLPGTGPGRGDKARTNFILSEFDVAEKTENLFKSLEIAGATADYSQGGWPIKNSIDGDLETGWAIGKQFFKDHWAAFELKTPHESKAKQSVFQFKLIQNYGRGRTIGRVKISATSADPVSLILTDEIRKILATKNPNKKQQKQLDDFLDESNPEKVALLKKIDTIKKEIDRVKPPSTLVMVEMDEMRDTFKLTRGDYLSPGKKVTAGVPKTLHPFDDTLPKNRLGLAKWIVDPVNPLLGRVTVNRWWTNLFGHGLVSSGEDFGTQSDPASHPQLLDWLATEFVDSGYSRKKIHKLIVMSSTFRQSAKLNSKLLELDPKNELYVRGPRFRMPAEMIRDHGLAVSGLLSTKLGGPPIMPFQPNDIWRAVGRNAPKWKAAENEDRFRRGVYVVWRRAAPYPSFVNFDAPDRAACVVNRPRTNTPLQALTLLNDRAYLEMAVSLAHQVNISKPESSVKERLAHAMRRCVLRMPADDEVAELEKIYNAELQRFKDDPKLAKEFLTSNSQVDLAEVKNESELAAMSVVANVLLNLDETINY